MSVEQEKYVAFLRGINVGGHHKVPMADLRQELGQLGFENVITILNSGNIIFDAGVDDAQGIEDQLTAHLEDHFGFPIPTIVKKADTILDLFEQDPFQDFTLTKETRFYISFLKNDMDSPFELPWISEDQSYRILGKQDGMILSVLDLSISGTPEAMGILERNFGKGITTRNWNTIGRVDKKVDAAAS